ncbi:MAG: DUF4212 domain-containing protein, partial [Gammaproteobacteria bacterium]
MTSTRKPAGAAPSPRPDRARAQAYWRANLRLVALLLGIWFAVSFGCGILLVAPLNTFSLGGFPLGFWFGQQGAIFAFVVL